MLIMRPDVLPAHLLDHGDHLITRVRSNGVAYERPRQRRSKRGRPRLYGKKLKLKHRFKQPIHTVGAYAYHFWMRTMTPIRRGSGNQHLHRKTEDYRRAVQRKIAAYERHIQIGLIAQGLLQYLALTFRSAVWHNFPSYLRTMNTQAPPSEWVVTLALRDTWHDFLRFSPRSFILKKFLMAKLDPRRCKNRELIPMDLAA